MIEVRVLPLPVEYLHFELKQINLSNLLVERFFFYYYFKLDSSQEIIFFEVSYYFQRKIPYEMNNTCSLN